MINIRCVIWLVIIASLPLVVPLILLTLLAKGVYNALS
jgi:hypothetical protein